MLEMIEIIFRKSWLMKKVKFKNSENTCLMPVTFERSSPIPVFSKAKSKGTSLVMLLISMSVPFLESRKFNTKVIASPLALLCKSIRD